ncbi:phosphomannomutase [Atopostipes suicloacalis DSM 15692]|uniref:Phosphomannomutase n=1 Tax=Atopostipes suicloacalis DSM 15692 TaxID=1121025 RepID=A0A1M4VPS2_9LACT|nr:phosphomannomutase/phosphoglucomutase [Atopostipes suicloacalis]SHE71111.1 phosphomannomutase [Atopostipes suicloacalis DSM 15692]
MGNTSLGKLINGSDIRGIAIDTKEHKANLTEKEVKKIANGFLNLLKEDKKVQRKPMRIAIGFDSRVSGPAIKEALVEVFMGAGVTILDAGLATTPAMFMATQFSEIDADAGIMITASHLPYFHNGLKFFTKEGGAEHEDMEKIIEYADSGVASQGEGHLEDIDLISYYADDLVQKIQEGTGLEKPLEDLHIVLDAGNGAGGFFAADVLEPLGAKTTGSQFLDPDGYFPNHIPNPDNSEAMASIQGAVLKNKADLGIIFDTDVDRAAVVDDSGEFINRNNLIALLAQIVLADEAEATIVTNSPTTSHLKTFIQNLGGKQYRYISGYRNVINKAIELNQEGTSTPLAIETSGHAAFRENYFLDDGAYVVAKILMLLPELNQKGQKVGDLIKELKQPAEAQEVRFTILDEQYQEYGHQVIGNLEEFVARTLGFDREPDNTEGIRVNVSEGFGSGWFLLRMSLHEPLLVLQVENDHEGSNHKVFQQLAKFFEKYDKLNLEKLEKILA